MTAEAGWVLLNGGPGWWAGVALAVALGLASGFTSARGLPAGRRLALLAVRVAAVALAAVAVLRPAREVDLTRARRPPLAVVLDTSRSMTLGPNPAGPQALAWLKDSASRLEALGALYRVELLGLGEPPPVLDPSATALTGEETPLGRTLEALARARPDLAGAVLLSDGRDTETPGEPPPGLPFPVYPLVAEGGPAPDLWVEGVDTPPVGFIRTPVEVRVRLGLAGLPAGPATVTLLEGGQPLRTETAALGPTGGEVTLAFTPTRTGRRAYRIEVTPRPGEATRENNRAQFALDVIRDKTRVLLVAGTPTWDVKFLRQRLARDPGIDLITFLILRTPQDLALVPQEELSLIPFPTRELFSEELPSFDAVLFANFNYQPYVPEHFLDNLARFVRDAGGGFAMLGGDRSFGLGGYERTSLAEILPVELGGFGPGQAFLPAKFRPRLTDAGAAHPLFQWGTTAAANRALWNDLPELEGANWVLRPRPGAVVLAENPAARNEHGPMPVVALGEYGAGRSLAVATDSLWHWALPRAGRGGDDGAYRDFWTRALRWLVHDPEMALVRLGLPPGPVRAGHDLKLRARVLDRAYAPARGARVTGRLRGEGGQVLELRWAEEAPGEYAAAPVRLPAPGLWRGELEAELVGDSLGRDRADFPVEGASPEGLRPGLDHAYLEALARATGGRTHRPGERELWSHLEGRGRLEVEVVGRRVEELWPGPGLLLLSVFLFGLDWTLRRFWE